MQQLKHIFISSCKKASELIDKKSVVKLTLRENMMLHIHTSFCDACTTYQKQSRILHDLLKEHIQNNDPEQVTQVINNELKEKIFSRLNKE
jgi:hypothetical protein